MGVFSSLAFLTLLVIIILMVNNESQGGGTLTELAREKTGDGW